jgi:hypothetical protein
MGSLVAYLGAAAFAIAAAWYTLAVQGLTVASEPRFLATQTLAQRRTVYFSWFVSTLQQERLYTGIGIGAFLCLMAVAIFVRNRFGQGALASVGVQAIGAGVALWVVANVAQLGGHRAVGLMATHGNPLETVGSIHFSIDIIDDAFELAAFALIGVGMLAFARSAMGGGAAYLAWGRFTMAIGLLMLALAGSYAADNGDLTDLLLLAGGGALLPAWLIWTGRLLRNEAN